MVEETKAGQLSEARNERIFRTEILPDYLPEDIGNAERPTLVVLGGQPGSGKTAVLTAVHTELEQSGPVIRIVADNLRSYHPEYLTDQTTHPERASRLTRTDAGIWSEKLLAAAMERGVHVVFETGMRSQENVEEIIMIGRKANYRIEAHVLAINPRVSWQGDHHRFEEMNNAGVAAVLPSWSDHDNAVSGLAGSLGRIERGRLADRIVLQAVDGEKLYDNVFERGQWRSAIAASQLLKATCSRPLSRDEIKRFAAAWEKVLSRMHARSAPAARIDEVRNQSRDDVATFLAERRRADADYDGQGKGEIALRLDRGHVPAIGVAAAGTSEYAHSAAIPDNSGANCEQHVRPGEVLIHAKEIPDLGKAEIDGKMRESSRLAEKRAEIERLSRLVYGNSAAESTTVEGIDGGRTGSVAAQDVRAGKLGTLAGEGRGLLRSESPERQTAKAYLPQLAAALEDYGRTVDFERHQIETRHREEQHRHRQEIRAPSEALSVVLHAPSHERANRLSATPALRRELDGITASINRRLAAPDRAALKAGDVDRLARGLGVSHDRAAALLRVQFQTQAAHSQAHIHRQHIEHGRNAALSIKR